MVVILQLAILCLAGYMFHGMNRKRRWLVWYTCKPMQFHM